MGLGLLIAGALALSDIANVNTDHVEPLLDTIEVGSFQVGSMATNLSILFIVIGVFIMIVSGLGLFGACCQNKCMLVVVSVCLCVFYFLNMYLNVFIRVHLVCIFLINLYFVSFLFIIACFLLIFFPQGAFKESKFLKFLYFYKKKIKFQLTKMKL